MSRHVDVGIRRNAVNPLFIAAPTSSMVRPLYIRYKALHHLRGELSDRPEMSRDTRLECLHGKWNDVNSRPKTINRQGGRVNPECKMTRCKPSVKTVASAMAHSWSHLSGSGILCGRSIFGFLAGNCGSSVMTYKGVGRVVQAGVGGLGGL